MQITNTYKYYANLAAQYQLPFMHINTANVDLDLLHHSDCGKYITLQAIPIARDQDGYTVALAYPHNIPVLQEKWGANTKFVITPLQDIIELLSQHFEKEYLRDITFKLYESNPELSAKHTFSLSEKIIFFAVFISLFIIPLVGDIRSELILNIVLTSATLLIWLYKFMLCLVGIAMPTANYAKKYNLDPNQLPFYTILVPLFQEQKNTLHQLTAALQRLDYPAEKLDIKFLLEAEDEQTLALLQTLPLSFNVQILKVPAGQPRTKPRACNYGLELAIGKYITIFDAEDQPEPDQLKAVLHTFQNANDEKLVCVQCPLNYYNRNENLLTRLFSLEYTFWFDVQLPALSQLNLPIPLGGTSNHFRTEFLRIIGGWDPFNVTEDADLGIRIHSLGSKVGMAYSTTYEEANCKLGNWLLQRSRWIKGYMQTYLVHMRHPIKLCKDLGLFGFMSFQFLIGGTAFFAAVNLFFWIVFLLSLGFSHYTHTLFTPELLHIAWFNFVAGNILLTSVHVIAATRRGLYKLAFLSLLLPFYWILISIASYISLYELIFKPSYWHKTTHGLSKYINNPEDDDEIDPKAAVSSGK